MKILFLTGSLFSLLLLSCTKNNKETVAGDAFTGTWVREGTSGSGPGNTITFTASNGENKMAFDCGAAPGPGVPSNANTPYKFENGKLSYQNYLTGSTGFYTMNSFAWVEAGKSFEVNFNELLLYMSAVYKVKFVKVN